MGLTPGRGEHVIGQATVRMIVVLLVLAILFMPAIVDALLYHDKIRFTIIILKEGVLEGFILGGVLLAIPGSYAIHPSHVADTANHIRVEYIIDPGELGDALEVMKAADSYPTITLILVDYERNRTLSIVYGSEHILSHTKRLNTAATLGLLREDPLAALRVRQLVLDEGIIENHRVAHIDWALGSRIPPFPWEEASAEACIFHESVNPTLGIYYRKLESHPAASQDTPGWFEERFIQLGEGSPSSYWARIRDKLVAAIYYVPDGVDLNLAVRSIARWALTGEEGILHGGVVLVPMSSLVGGNGWRSSLEPIVYNGLINIFTISMTDYAGISGPAPLYVEVTIFINQQVGSSQGLLFDGAYIAGQSTIKYYANTIMDTYRLGNGTISYLMEGSIYSPGDYMVIAWRTIGSTTCMGREYRIVSPVAIPVSLYTLSLDYSSIEARPGATGRLDFMVDPGKSVVLDAIFYPVKDRPWATYRILATNSSYNIINESAARVVYHAKIGGPVLGYAGAIIGSANGSFESLSVMLLSEYFDTGYTMNEIIKIIRIRYFYNFDGTVWARAENLVPKALDGTDGIDNLSWGGINIIVAPREEPPHRP